MPRPQRLRLAGIPQHVVQRGIDRQAIFFENTDRQFYLRCLSETAQWYGLAVHAYCLMTNHVHLLVTPRDADSIWRAMQRLGRHYVRYVNDRAGRTGTLWDGRYRACLVDRENYLLTCYRYIELNPVRAGMVKHAGGYPWSSHRHTAWGQSDPLVSAHPCYLALGDSDLGRREAYRRLFCTQLSTETLDEVRAALQHNHVLGGARFREHVSSMLGRRLGRGRPGRPPKDPSPTGCLQ